MRAVPRRERLEGCDEVLKSSAEFCDEDVVEAGGAAMIEAAVCRAVGRGGGVATTTLGYGLFALATLGIDRLLAREPLLYAGGGGDATWIFEFFRDSDLGVFGGSSAMLPFRLSLDPPSVRRDIIRCSRPDRVLDDSNEITLAFMLGLYAGSSGGPASKNAIRSCAAREICGLLPPGLRGEEGGSEGGERARPALGWGGATASCIISSSPSDPFITSSRSIDSLLF